MQAHPPSPPSVWSRASDDREAPVIYVDRSGRAFPWPPEEFADEQRQPGRAIATALPLSLLLWAALLCPLIITR